MRTFIAIEIPEKIKKTIERWQAPLKEAPAAVSWVKPGNIHITLKFLGDVEDSRINEIGESVKSAVGSFSPFRLSIEGAGGFPNLKHPRVIWVGIINEQGELKRLAESVDNEMSSLGFPREKRSFKPHLTVGRVKSQRRIETVTELIHLNRFYGGEFQVENVIVMKSQLHPAGSIYTPQKVLAL